MNTLIVIFAATISLIAAAPCANSYQCPQYPYALCVGNQCVCARGYSGAPPACTCAAPNTVTWYNGEPTCLSANQCVNNYDCVGNPVSSCSASGGAIGTCQCPTNRGFAAYNGGCSCPAGRRLEYDNGVAYCLDAESCTADYHCHGDLATCSAGKCVCPATFSQYSDATGCTCPPGSERKYASDGTVSCVAPPPIGTCSTDGDCVGNPESFCNNGQCACRPVGFGQYSSLTGCACLAGRTEVYPGHVPACIAPGQCYQSYQCVSQYAFCTSPSDTANSLPSFCQCYQGFSGYDTTNGCTCSGRVSQVNTPSVGYAPICLTGNQCLYDYECGYPKKCVGSVTNTYPATIGTCSA